MTKKKKPSRLTKTLLDTAKDMRRAGLLDAAAYDKEHVGRKVQVLQEGVDPTLPPHEQRKVYDTILAPQRHEFT